MWEFPLPLVGRITDEGTSDFAFVHQPILVDNAFWSNIGGRYYLLDS